MLSPAQLPRMRAGAVLYGRGAVAETLLADFVGEIRRRGWRVGGLIQQTVRGTDGRKSDMRLIEADTGRSMSIAQALGRGSGGDGCTVDPGAVAEATHAVRRAIAGRVDLLVVNKFSHLECKGGGLADEMLEAMAEGIPVLTALRPDLLDEWLAFCGGHCDLLVPDAAALWRWWGPHRLYDDLRLGVGEGVAHRVAVGLKWVMVEGSDGAGFAISPARGGPGMAPLDGSAPFTGRPLRELAGLVDSWHPLEAAIGMAAINAYYNRFDLAGAADNGLDAFAAAEGRVVVVGAFPGIAERLPGCHVIDRDPAPGQYPESASEWLLPGCAAAVITASTAANRSLPRLLDLAAGASVALVGPSAPLSPRLFDHGVEVLSGLVVEDVEGAAHAVMEGGGAKALKRHARQVTLRR